MGFYNTEFREKTEILHYSYPFGVLKKGILIENLFPWTLVIRVIKRIEASAICCFIMADGKDGGRCWMLDGC